MSADGLRPLSSFPMGEAAAPLVLASASPSRRTMLENAGLSFSVHPAAVDEDAVKESLKAEGASAACTAETLAELKAQRVSANYPGSLVIGADQMLECEEHWFDKPADRDGAFESLRALQGRSHVLWSAVCLVRDGSRIWHHGAPARMTMRPLSDDFIAAYLDSVGDKALSSVGAYQLEGLGAQLFSGIDGDFFTILGLPLLPLLEMLRANGVLVR